jgi:hypothetical protein
MLERKSAKTISDDNCDAFNCQGQTFSWIQEERDDGSAEHYVIALTLDHHAIQYLAQP